MWAFQWREDDAGAEGADRVSSSAEWREGVPYIAAPAAERSRRNVKDEDEEAPPAVVRPEKWTGSAREFAEGRCHRLGRDVIPAGRPSAREVLDRARARRTGSGVAPDGSAGRGSSNPRGGAYVTGS
jgi:hypothetical protein